jgi:hypothetical protein
VVSSGVRQHAIIVPLVRSNNVFTTCTPIPLDEPLTTKTDSILLLRCTAYCIDVVVKSISGKIATPLDIGGAGAWNDDDDDDDDDNNRDDDDNNRDDDDNDDDDKSILSVNRCCRMDENKHGTFVINAFGFKKPCIISTAF